MRNDVDTQDRSTVRAAAASHLRALNPISFWRQASLDAAPKPRRSLRIALTHAGLIAATALVSNAAIAVFAMIQSPAGYPEDLRRAAAAELWSAAIAAPAIHIHNGHATWFLLALLPAALIHPLPILLRDDSAAPPKRSTHEARIIAHSLTPILLVAATIWPISFARWVYWELPYKVFPANIEQAIESPNRATALTAFLLLHAYMAIYYASASRHYLKQTNVLPRTLIATIFAVFASLTLLTAEHSVRR